MIRNHIKRSRLCKKRVIDYKVHKHSSSSIFSQWFLQQLFPVALPAYIWILVCLYLILQIKRNLWRYNTFFNSHNYCFKLTSLRHCISIQSGLHVCQTWIFKPKVVLNCNEKHTEVNFGTPSHLNPCSVCSNVSFVFDTIKKNKLKNSFQLRTEFHGIMVPQVSSKNGNKLFRRTEATR